LEEEQFRRTDRETGSVAGSRPKSVFQVDGAGTVGTGSLRGMPFLLQLEEAGFNVWPLESGLLDEPDFLACAFAYIGAWGRRPRPGSGEGEVA
jgi:hypothetical protein